MRRQNVHAVFAALLAAFAGLACFPAEPERAVVAPRVAAVRSTFAPLAALDVEFARIPAGRFAMGSPWREEGRNWDESPVHEVTISRPFFIGRTEVTNSQYRPFADAHPEHRPAWTDSQARVPGVEDAYRRLGDAIAAPDRPVVGVSWYDAVAFANWRSVREGFATCFAIHGSDVQPVQNCLGYRLPTEAEWEYAARAGTTTRFPCGDGDECLGAEAWYRDNSRMNTHTVGGKAANPWGVYDMLGNVWEWTSDRLDIYPFHPQIDPSGSRWLKRRVLRGGSWEYPASGCRPANRGYYVPSWRDDTIGFRLARTVP
jgi:formylglycine-generating enzyme required for sulfatase activity